MASSTDISTYLEQIQDAVYGAQVRSAIYNAIALCYRDVTRGTTLLDSAIENAESVTNTAQSIVTDVGAAKKDYENAKSEYTTLNSQGSSYVSQITQLRNEMLSIKDAIDGTYTSVREARDEVAANKTAAANAANSAQEYLSDIEGYDTKTIGQRLTDLAGLEDTLNAIASTANGYRNSAETAKTGAETAKDNASYYYNLTHDLYNQVSELNIPQLNTNVSNVLQRMDDMDALEKTFSDYSDSFAQYDSTFGNYYSTFTGYIATFTGAIASANSYANSAQESVTTIAGYRDEITAIKSEIDSLGFETIAANASGAVTTAEETLAEVARERQLLENMNLDNTLEVFQRYYTQTEEAAQRAENSVQNLDDSINAANSAATNANNLVTQLTTLQSSLNTVLTLWNNSLYGSIQQNLTAMGTAVENAQSAAEMASSAVDSANALLDRAEGITNDWGTRRTQMDEYLVDAETALTNLNDAVDAVNNMTVSSEPLAYWVPSYAEISDEDGHKNIHFHIQKGDPGSANIIKGPAYSTLQALKNAVTNPSEGDQYNVGSSAPYTIYRWTGSDWENEGQYTVSLDAISNGEIDAVCDGIAVDGGAKYLDIRGFEYYTNGHLKNELAKKVTSVSGKGLSTNDFTNAYKTKIDNHETSITVLQTNKVDTVAGKGLSTNDLTNALKNQITTNANGVSDLYSTKLNRDFNSLDSFSAGEWSSGTLAVQYGTSVYKLPVSTLVSSLGATGDYVSSMNVASLSEAASYLGL